MSLPTRKRKQMPVLPRLKAVPVHGHGGTLVLSRRSLERIHLDDPSGASSHC